MNVSIATVAKDVGTMAAKSQTTITIYMLVMASLMITGAVVTGNANARIDGRRSSLPLLAIVALIALFATRRIPAQRPTANLASEPSPWPPSPSRRQCTTVSFR